MRARNPPSLCHPDKRQMGDKRLCKSCYMKVWRKRNKDKLEVYRLNRKQVYYALRSLGIPADHAQGKSYKTYIEHLAWMRQYHKEHRAEARVYGKKTRDKQKALYGERPSRNEAARMRQEYLKGVVNLGTKDIS